MSIEKEEAEILFEKYQARIESIPVHLQDSVGVLYSVVLSVSANGNNQTTDRGSEINHLRKAELNDFYNNDGKFIKLTDVTSTSFLSNLLRNNEVWKLQKEPLKPFVVPTEDQFQKKLFQIQTILTENSSVDASSSSKENLRGILMEIFEFEYEGRIRLHISRLLADGILPLKSLMSEVERGIKESELLTFTSLSSTDLYRSNQLQEFSELILQKTKALPNFTGTLTAADGEEGSILKRKYFKSLSAFLFAQILSQELQTNPLTLKKYYPMTDELLYCLHWPPPDRRNSKSVWQRTIMNESDSLEPSESEVIDATNKNREVTWETVTMTPAGQMIAMIHRLNQNNRLCWFSAYVNSYLVGVRLISPSQQADSSFLSPASKENLKGSSIEGEHAAPSKEEALSSTSVFLFSCESNENIRLLAYRGPVLPKNKKPDKQGTILLSTQFPNELEVQVHSSGDIRIASSINRLLLQSTVAQQRKKQQFYPLFPETSRFISEFGQIVRHYENPRQAPFSHEIYYPDGRRDLFLLFPFYKHTAAQAKSSSLFYNPNTASPLTPSSSSNSKLSTSLEAAVLHKIPSDTLFLRFLLTDAIECYNEQHQLIKTVSANDIIPSETFQEFVDAESKCIVKYYPDGRIITEYVNGLKIVLFPDGTKFLHNEKTKC